MKRLSRLEGKHLYSPSSHTNNSPGNWKSFANLPRPSYQSNGAKSPLAQKEIVTAFNNKIRQKNDKKKEIMKKVKDIQEKITPLLNGDRRRYEDEEIGWNNKMEERIMKLETSLDSLGKDMEIKMRKKTLQIEKYWQTKFEQLLKRYHNQQVEE